MVVLVIGVFVLFLSAASAMLRDFACESQVIAPAAFAGMGGDGLPDGSLSTALVAIGEHESIRRDAVTRSVGGL